MAIHFVSTAAPGELRVSPVGAFRGVREQFVPCTELSRAHLYCQKGGNPVAGDDCEACPRFLDWRPAEGGGVVRCRWSDRDSVWERMTWVRALDVVAPETTCRDADAQARKGGHRHLLVVSKGLVMGVACRCDLVEPAPDGHEPIASRMAHEIFVVHAHARLGDAVAAMASLAVGCLPVVGDGMLVGMITRGDLRRTGVPEPLLGARYCAACGSPHGVRRAPGADLQYCLECLAARRAWA